MKKYAVSLVLILVLFWPARPAAGDEAGDLWQLFEDEWAARLLENPLFSSSMGEVVASNILPQITPEDYARRLEKDENFRDRLEDIDQRDLSAEDRLNYDLFEFVLFHRIKNARFRPYRIPFLSDSGFHTSIVRMAESMPFDDLEDYENYLARLRAIPTYFAQQIENMRLGIAEGFTMPRAILEGIVPSISAQIVGNADDSSFFEPFKSLPESFDEETRWLMVLGGEQVVMQDVVGAYETLLTFFTEEYMPAARTTLGANRLPGGEEYYRYLVTYYTTLDLTPEEVHETGLAEVARIRGEMEAIIEELGFEGSFMEFLSFLRTDARFYVLEPEQLLKEASYIAKKIDAIMPAYFGILPRQPYGVRAVPDDIAPNYTTGRYWAAPANGKRGGLYMVNTYALDKRPLYNLPALTLHEAVPGHHHQTSVAGELENVPDFRRELYPHAFGEGWGLYSEKLGVEMGIYNDLYAEFGRLTYEMWRAGRLVVDTGIHFMGWSRSDAIELFEKNTALSSHNIRTEVDRYISWPGQALAYKIGEMKILELRARAELALGDGFDIRAFHDAVLGAGGVPMKILEARIDAFIAAELKQEDTE